MDFIRDSHYFLLPTQGNIYTLTNICQSNGINKVLFASLRRKLFLLDYTDNVDGCLRPNVREILFTYIPNGAEIISLDVYNRSTVCDDFFIGITIIKLNSDHTHDTYLNIYSEQDLEANPTFNIESVAQNCLSIDLTFIPYQLYHTELIQSDDGELKKEIVWLLSGSDVKVHVFREDKVNHSYSEIDISKYFPELVSPPSIILWLDILHTDNYQRRVTTFGCECGLMKLAIVDTLTSSILALHSNQFEGPISQAKLFYLDQHYDCPDKLTEIVEKTELEEKQDITEEDKNISHIHLVVASTLQKSAVYMDVVENGLSCRYSLEDSENYDASLCVCTADIDMDGQKEIILGTYAQELLMYKYIDDKWTLQMQRSLEHPIHSLDYIDVTNDGVKELIVLTLGGLHVMQHSHDHTYKKFISRLKKLMKLDKETDNGNESDKLISSCESYDENKEMDQLSSS